MKFNTHYDMVHRSPGEVNSGEILVETAGYVPAQKRIESMMMAGQYLQQLRREQFDNQGNIPDEELEVDPTRSPNFDIVDAQRIMGDVNGRVRQRRHDQQSVVDPVKIDPESAQDRSGEVKKDVVAQ